MPDEVWNREFKSLLAEAADVVSDLPQHLQEAAFGFALKVLSGRIGLASTRLRSDMEEPPKLPSAMSVLGDSFGEFYQRYPTTVSESDKLLIAGAYSQAQDPEKTFSTTSAHDLLVDIGVKLTNPGVFIKRLISKKYVFQIGRDQKRRKFRVSAQGDQYLRDLVGGAV